MFLQSDFVVEDILIMQNDLLKINQDDYNHDQPAFQIFDDFLPCFNNTDKEK